MNILFLTISHIESVEERGIYTDLMRKFRNEGHKVVIVSPIERKFKQATLFQEKDGVGLLKVKTLNLQKTNLIEKGIGTLLLEYQFIRAVQKKLSDIRFDLILYSTPPITLTGVIRYIKKRDGAYSYLLLKDIFPQNAVDLGLMKNNGLLHRFFRQKEKTLYAISDWIGCMSPANVKYVCDHNSEIDTSRVEICPNSIELEDNLELVDKENIRRQFGLPVDKTILIYGGNLGKPQGLDFLLRILKANEICDDRYFVIIGSGTEYEKIKDWFTIHSPSNSLLMKGLPKKKYDQLVRACDIGLIFLDSRFTIPNYPSRLLSYLEYKMPILAAIDKNTDLGSIAEKNGYGFSCINGDLDRFNLLLDKMVNNTRLLTEMGETGYKFLQANYTAEQSYRIITKHLCIENL